MAHPGDDYGRGSGSSLPLPVLLTAGIATFVAVVVSGISIYLQLINYRKPFLQRMVVRIMVMVPIYAVSSLISLFSLDAAFFIDVVRDIYEAFVIYCFFVLLLDYLGGERSVLILLHGRPPKPAVFPVSLWRHEIDVSDPYMFLFLKRGILQYVQVKPMLAVASLIMKATGTYNEGDFRARSGYLYVSIIYNISICLALYCLAVFWLCVSDDLKPFRPVPKFLCVKGILFFSFWQSILVSFLVAVNAITRLGPYTDSEHISLGLTDTLICIEMPFFALAHMYAFSYRDFVKSPADSQGGVKAPVYVARMRMGYALRDAFGLKDLAEDTRETLRGGGLTYREFEPSEGGMHIGAGRERRIRAGLRYSAGGKRKYWLPEVNGLADDSRGWLGRHADNEDVRAPLLASDAHNVVHDAPDRQRQSQFPGDDASAEDEDEYALHFSDELAGADETLYEHARKYVFGDYAYPVVDVSSEDARRAMWDEEARIVREGVSIRPAYSGRKGEGSLPTRTTGYGATGTRKARTYEDDEDEGFVSEERVVDFEEGSVVSGVKLGWTKVGNKDKGRSPGSSGSTSVSASPGSSGSPAGRQLRPSGSTSRLNPHSRARTTSEKQAQAPSSHHRSNSPHSHAHSNQNLHSSSTSRSPQVRTPPNLHSNHQSSSPSHPSHNQRPGARTPLAEPDAVDLVISIPDARAQTLSVPPHAHSPLSHSPGAGRLRRVWNEEQSGPGHDRWDSDEHEQRGQFVLTEGGDGDQEGLEERAIEERLGDDVPEVQDAEQVVRAETPPAYARMGGYGYVSPEDDGGDNPWA
ncbi:DUF300-domain-containing protein [Leucogyrophana mollusca]|uniref:DUF300-domain-containing protein n=1 Tax=Leucogyrophana mollusca TaxID=85980 RepID=A0ACB8BT94_9AGAM|nr:DUF300-domain-containing protein [Leucogyrophana mollusca]